MKNDKRVDLDGTELKESSDSHAYALSSGRSAGSLHSDFKYAVSGENIKAAWIMVFFFTTITFGMAGLWPALVVCFFSCAMPLLVKWSYLENEKIYRDYSKIYANSSKKEECEVKITVLEGRYITYVVEVFHEGVRFVCEPLPTIRKERLRSGTGVYPVTFHPETGYPLVIEQPSGRIWVEKRSFGSLVQ